MFEFLMIAAPTLVVSLLLMGLALIVKAYSPRQTLRWQQASEQARVYGKTVTAHLFSFTFLAAYLGLGNATGVLSILTALSVFIVLKNSDDDNWLNRQLKRLKQRLQRYSQSFALATRTPPTLT